MNSDDADPAALMRALWPNHGPTPLLQLPELAKSCGVAQVLVKDESVRPLGSFKVTGGIWAALQALARASGASRGLDLVDGRAAGRTLPAVICASHGNHGLAVAAAAEIAKTAALIYLPEATCEARVRRLRAHGAELIFVKGSFDDAAAAAASAAAAGEGILVADTSDDKNCQVVADIIAGYELIAGEIAGQIEGATPTHVFVQAGVGGLAAAIARGLHARMAPGPKVVVVEPASAACVGLALSAGSPRDVAGDLGTSAEMLSCGRASAQAVSVLLRHHAVAIDVDEATLKRAVSELMRAGGPASTPSGATGVAGLLSARPGGERRSQLGLGEDSRILLIVTECSVADADEARTSPC